MFTRFISFSVQTRFSHTSASLSSIFYTFFSRLSFVYACICECVNVFVCVCSWEDFKLFYFILFFSFSFWFALQTAKAVFTIVPQANINEKFYISYFRCWCCLFGMKMVDIIYLQLSCLTSMQTDATVW